MNINYLNNDKYYIKYNVEINEYKIHKYIYNLNIVNIPKIYYYDKKDKFMIMQKIANQCLSDEYGESSKNINKNLFNKIREIIKKLYLNNIEYPDITGYNFIEYNNKMWIIDFGDAKFNTNINNKFIIEFIKGKNEWNKKI
jgi:tRNA A-37 threonylcarbamoyl transferase component Bud32